MSNSAVEGVDHISIARQPIVDADKNIVAYELFNRSRGGTRHTVNSDVGMVLHAIANSGTLLSMSHTDLFVHALHDGLDGDHWDFLDPKKVVASVPLVENHDQSRIESVAVGLAKLRARGVRLSFHHAVVAPVYKPWQALADFIKVDLASVTKTSLGPVVAAVKMRTSAIPIAMKVESQEQFEHTRSIGMTHFQGYWFSVPEIVKPRVLAAGELGAIELLNLTSKAAPIDDIENALKKDAALGVNLLRIINSASTGLRQKVTSLRQAVMLMGYEKLAKWAALVMLTASSDSSNFATSSAGVRGRMMELLAQQEPATFDAGSAFLIGLLSRIDAMLGCPMQSALGRLSLNDDIVETLLGGPGPYGEMLALVKACESEDDAEFAQAFSKLNFTLRQINMAQVAALAWADTALGDT